MSTAKLEVVFGAGFIGNANPFIGEQDLERTYQLLLKYDIKKLDSAQLYGESEKRLGETKAARHFGIDTKWLMGWSPGTGTRESVIATAKESVRKLGCTVDMYYLHCPDKSVPIEDTLSGVNEAHKLGLFKRFGLSNFSAEEVQKIHDICSAEKYILPTVFQGNYAPVARRLETHLIPTLRRLGISFYAYSPLAGGFLTKSKDEIIAGAGRFNTNHSGGMFDQMYLKDSYLDALAEWEEIANQQNCSRAELAYRWVAHDSVLNTEHGDAIVIGASKFEQIEPTLRGIQNGPLNPDVVKRISDLWLTIQHDAPLDAFAK